MVDHTPRHKVAKLSVFFEMINHFLGALSQERGPLLVGQIHNATATLEGARGVHKHVDVPREETCVGH